MSKILTEHQIKDYAEHATNKWPELSSEREIIEALAESHLNLFEKVSHLEKMNSDKFDALQELAFALWKENPAAYESISKHNEYLNALTERTGSVF